MSTTAEAIERLKRGTIFRNYEFPEDPLGVFFSEVLYDTGLEPDVGIDRFDNVFVRIITNETPEKRFFIVTYHFQAQEILKVTEVEEEELERRMEATQKCWDKLRASLMS